MKKKLFYFFVLICSMSLFTACSNDDEEDTTPVDYNNEQLEMTLSDAPLAGKTVTYGNSVVVLKNVIPGEPELSIPVEGKTTFTGTSTNENRVVTVSGKVDNGVLKLGVELDVKAPIAGTFELMKKEMPLVLDYTTTAAKVSFLGEQKTPVEVSEFVTFIGAAVLPKMLGKITFHADGNITASYSSDLNKPVFQESPKGYAFYNIVGKQLYVSINLGTIMGTSTRESASPLESILAMLSSGLPLNYTLENVEGKGYERLTILVDKTMMVPFMSILPVLAELLPDGVGFPPLVSAEQIKTLLKTEIPAIVTGSTKFDLKLIVTK